MSDKTFTILLCGVGGQGTITAATLLARVASAAGKCCKVSEIHGMAQRGGVVTMVVRFGDTVSTMVCDEGCADNIVSFETTEALRNLAYLKEGGVLVVNDEDDQPLPVLTGKAEMPARARERLDELGATLHPCERTRTQRRNSEMRERRAARCARREPSVRFFPLGRGHS